MNATRALEAATCLLIGISRVGTVALHSETDDAFLMQFSFSHSPYEEWLSVTKSGNLARSAKSWSKLDPEPLWLAPEQ